MKIFNQCSSQLAPIFGGIEILSTHKIPVHRCFLMALSDYNYKPVSKHEVEREKRRRRNMSSAYYLVS